MSYNFFVPLNVREEEVYMYQGYQKKDLPPEQRVRELFHHALSIAQTLTSPMIYWDIVNVKRQDSLGIYLENGSHFSNPDFEKYWRHPDRVVVVAATIGSRLEERVSELMEQGEYALALMLDSIGSDGVESMIHIIKKIPEHNNIYAGEKVGVPLSPGHGSWSIEEQKVIFSILCIQEITLTSSLMMIPRKSLSLALPIGKDVIEDKENIMCEICNNLSCSFRKIFTRCSG